MYLQSITMLLHLFEYWGYSEAQHILLPPIANLNNAPATTCGSYDHDTGFLHCAQRQCFEYLIYLRPVLAPYLDPTILVYKPLVPHSKCPQSTFDGVTLKFGEMELEEPEFKKLSKVRLPHYYNGATNCQFCVAGTNGCACTIRQTQGKAIEYPKGGPPQAPDQTARATHCEF